VVGKPIAEHWLDFGPNRRPYFGMSRLLILES
jgi:hypothetical protein